MSDTQVIHLSVAKPRLNQNSILATSSLRHQYSRSSTKRIYQSVFRIIDFDENEELTFEIQETNSSKIGQLVNDQNVIYHLYQKMKNQGNLNNYPILKVCCQEVSNSTSNQLNLVLDYDSLYQLEYSDLNHIFGRFGDLNNIYLSQDMKFGFIFFTTFHSAYIASKLLNQTQFAGKMTKLHVNWVNPTDYQCLIPNLSVYLNSIDWQLMYKYCSGQHQQINVQQNFNANNNQKQNKLTCRYDIQIENQRDFQVARRIIGSKGCHMKRIIEESIELAKNTSLCRNNPKHLENANQMLKLRLRGRGSGYKEGPDQQESQENLHLCVSAKDEICYKIACEKVETLLQHVYQQYYEYTLEQYGRGIKIEVTRNSSFQQIVPQSQYDQVSDYFYTQPNSFYGQDKLNFLRITPQQICELLEMRNKARRQLNFGEADRIRNYLKNCGVCLIDEKGRRGRAMDVTTWKYVF